MRCAIPGLVVLHDTHLHHARAAFLLREKRAADYRAEFRWNHPDVPPDAAELAVAGLDCASIYDWPMVRSLIEASRLVAVHGEGARRELIESIPNSTTPNSQVTPRANSQAISERIVSIRLGHGQLVRPDERQAARERVRAQYGIAEDAVLFGVFGGLTPEKRIPQILRGVPRAPAARAGGAAAARRRARGPLRRRGRYRRATASTDRVTLTGYLRADAELTDHLAACDVSLNLRWPTARETSGPWLRALAAGSATSSPTSSTWGTCPRWTRGRGRAESSEAARRGCCEAPSDLRRHRHPRRGPFAAPGDAAAGGGRRSAGAARARGARTWWAREHSLEAMADDYERVMREAAARPDPRVDLPAHMRNDGDATLRALLEPFGVGDPLRDGTSIRDRERGGEPARHAAGHRRQVQRSSLDFRWGRPKPPRSKGGEHPA